VVANSLLLETAERVADAINLTEPSFQPLVEESMTDEPTAQSPLHTSTPATTQTREIDSVVVCSKASKRSRRGSSKCF